MLSSCILGGNLDNFVSCFNKADNSISNNSLNVFSFQKLIESSLVFESDSLSLEFINLCSEK
jgi:hypothetical protein